MGITELPLKKIMSKIKKINTIKKGIIYHFLFSFIKTTDDLIILQICFNIFLFYTI